MEIIKICYLKSSNVPVIVGALGIIKKVTYKHIKKIIDNLSQ